MIEYYRFLHYQFLTAYTLYCLSEFFFDKNKKVLMSIRLSTCDNIQGTGAAEFDYPTSFTGAQLLTQACANLQKEESGNLRVLLRGGPNAFAWVDPSRTLAEYGAQNGMVLFVLMTNIPVAIHTTGGAIKKILVDITKTVKQLVPYVAEKLRAGNSVGYSLFAIKPNGEHVPLDFNKTLPEQTTEYDNVFFKRRYYIFTKSQIKDRASALLIFNDVKAHLESGKLQISPEKQIDLSYFSIYATNPNSTPNEIPANINPAIKENVKAKMLAKKPPSKEEAIENYLTLAHTIPGFGCEAFQANISANDGHQMSGTLVIGPKTFDILTSQGQTVYSIPYVRYVNSGEANGIIYVKTLSSDGSELQLQIQCQESSIVHSLLTGYVTLLKEIGAEVISEGFSKEDSIGSTNDDFQKFAKYYTIGPDGKYLFYPGMISEYVSKLYPKLGSIQNSHQQQVSEIVSLLEDLKSRPFKQSTLLKLIFKTDALSQDPTVKSFIDHNTFLTSLLPLSTVNITVGGLETMIDLFKVLLKCQKIIRSEIMIKVPADKKKIIEQWVVVLKSYKTFFVDAHNQLSIAPTRGDLLQIIQARLYEIYFKLDGLRAFVESIISLSPGSAYLPAIEICQSTLKDILIPLIPPEPLERLRHVFKLQQMLFSISIVLAIAFDTIRDPKISSNADLYNKLSDVISALGKAYSKFHEDRKLLTIRPFALPFIDKAKEDIIELQHALLSCKQPADFASSVIGVPTFSESIAFAKKYIEKSIAALNGLKSEPFRQVPDSQKIKNLHDSLVDTMAKFLQKNVNLTDQNSKDLYKKINNQALQIKPIVTFFKMNMDNPQRNIFIHIEKARKILQDAMSHVQALSTILCDATLVHYFQNILNIMDAILANHIPTYAQFNNLMKEMLAVIQEHISIIDDSQVITDNLAIISKSSNPDREIAAFQAMKDLLELQIQDKNIPPSKLQKLKAVNNMINLVILCINQLPIKETVSAPEFSIPPFYSGKDIKTMGIETLPQLQTLSQVFSNFKIIPFFAQNKRITSIMEYWEKYLMYIAQQLSQMQYSESNLLNVIKDVVRKKGSVIIFSTVMADSITDIKPFNQNINTFYTNLETIIDKILKPHIKETDIQIFVEDIGPQMYSLQELLTNLPNSALADPELANTLRQILQLSGTNLSGLDLQSQQKLADNLYQLLDKAISLLQNSDDPALCLLSNRLTELAGSLGRFTEFSLSSAIAQSAEGYSSQFSDQAQIGRTGDLAAMVQYEGRDHYQEGKEGSSVHYKSPVQMTVVIPSRLIQNLCNSVMDNLGVISEDNFKMMDDLFSKLTADKDLLTAPIAIATSSVKTHSVRAAPYDALRTIIHSQANNTLKTDQLRKLAIKFSMLAAQLSSNLRPHVANAQNQTQNLKARYYATQIAMFLDSFNPQILLESESIPSVAVTYNQMRDIRAGLPLLVREANNPNLTKDAEIFNNIIDQADLSLSLYFAAIVEDVMKQSLSVYASQRNTQKRQEISKLLNILQDPSRLVTTNFTNLAVLSQAYEGIEDDIVPIISQKTDALSTRLLNQFQQLKEFKIILQQWAYPFTEFDPTTFRLYALSDVVDAQSTLNVVKQVYDKEILKVPLLLRNAASRLTSLNVLTQGVSNQVPQFVPKVSETSQIVKEILEQYELLSHDEVSYKADLRLHELLPKLFANVDSFVQELTVFNEPDYRNAQIGRANINNPKQLDILLSTVEDTPIYDETSKIIEHLKTFDTANMSQNITRTFQNLISLIPTMASLQDKDIELVLADSIKELFDTLNTPGKTIDDLFAVAPKVLAAMARLLPNLSEESKELLNANVTSLMDVLNRLSTARPEEIPALLNPLRAQLTKLSTYLTMKGLEESEIRRHGRQEASNLVVALNTNNINQIYQSTVNLNSIFAAAIDRGLEMAMIPKLSKDLITLENQVTQLTQAQVAEYRDKVISALVDELMSISDSLSKVDSLNALLDFRTDRKLMAQGSKIDSVHPLLEMASCVQLMAHRGLELTKNVPANYIFEYIDKYFLSMTALSKFIDTRSKGSLRMFKRRVDNTGDLVDDLLLDGPFFEQSGYANQKTNFIKTCADVLASISTFNVGYATSVIPSTFNLIITKEIPKISERANILLQTAGALVTSNAKPELNAPFSNAANAFHAQITTLTTSLTKATDSNILKIELPLLEAIHTLASCANDMTDEVPLTYDPDQASRIPRVFELPNVSNAANIKAQEAAQNAINAVNGLSLDQYAGYIGQNPPNSQLVDTTLSFNKQLEGILEKVLLVSLCSINLQNKLNLTTAATQLCTGLGQLNRAIRSKCLASPNWLVDARNAMKDITEKNLSIISLCEEAKSLADNEDTHLSAIRQKIFAVLNPLQESINNVENSKDEIEKLQVTSNREFTINFCDLACSGANILCNVMLHAKDFPNDLSNFDGALSKGESLTQLLNQLVQLSNGGKQALTPDQLIELNKNLSVIFDAVIGQIADVGDASSMRDQLSIISKGITALGESVQRAKTEETPQESLNTPEAQQRLKTRLQLESSVIRFRWKLEFHENQMKGFGQ